MLNLKGIFGERFPCITAGEACGLFTKSRSVSAGYRVLRKSHGTNQAEPHVSLVQREDD